jgi:hypothetical protein
MREHQEKGYKAYSKIDRSDLYIGLLGSLVDGRIGVYMKGLVLGYTLLYTMSIDSLDLILDWKDKDDWELTLERIQ